MDSPENQVISLEMLAKNEERVGQLYIVYAETFPEMREFWSGLADDEKTHAMWIRVLEDMTHEGKLSFNSERLKSTTILKFSSNIEKEIDKTSKTRLSLIDALSVAISIEENLIESKYFEALETDSTDIKRILKDLDAATKEHAQKLREVWNLQRQRQQ